MAEGVNRRGSKEEGELSFFDVVNTLLRHRRVVVSSIIGAALLLGLWGFLQPDRYAASATFVPRSAAGGADPGLLSMARQFGVDVGGGQPGHSPAFYAELLRSRDILRVAVLAEYEPSSGAPTNLVDWYGIESEPGGRPAWLLAVMQLRGNVVASARTETGLVDLEVTSRDPALAEQIADRLLELVHQFNLDSRQIQAAEEERFASERLGDAAEKLAAAEQEMGRFLEQNRSFRNSPELTFEYERLQRQVYMRQEIYSSFLQAREQARIEALRDIPLIAVVATAEGSAQPEGLGAVVWAVIGTVLGVMLGTVAAFALDVGRKARSERLPAYQEYGRLREETLRDLRRPLGLIRAPH